MTPAKLAVAALLIPAFAGAVAWAVAAVREFRRLRGGR